MTFNVDPPFNPENHQPGGRRVQITCADGHERFVIDEYFADDDIWRSDGYAVDDEPMGGWFRTRRTYRVLRAEGEASEVTRNPGMDDDFASGQFGQYRFACDRCPFNEVRTDDASGIMIPLSQGPSISERQGKASRQLFAVFDQLVDSWPGPGVATISGRDLVRLAWGSN